MSAQWLFNNNSKSKDFRKKKNHLNPLMKIQYEHFAPTQEVAFPLTGFLVGGSLLSRSLPLTGPLRCCHQQAPFPAASGKGSSWARATHTEPNQNCQSVHVCVRERASIWDNSTSAHVQSPTAFLLQMLTPEVWWKQPAGRAARRVSRPERRPWGQNPFSRLWKSATFTAALCYRISFAISCVFPFSLLTL